MEDHMEVFRGYHLTLAVKRNSILEQEVSRLSKEVQDRDQAMSLLQRQGTRKECRLDEMATRITELEQKMEKYSQLEARIDTLEGVLRVEVATGQPSGASSETQKSAVAKTVEKTAEQSSAEQPSIVLVSTCDHLDSPAWPDNL